MSLLQSAEIILGYVYTWPSVILEYLFITPPTFLTVRTLVCFHYGIAFPKKWPLNCLKCVTMTLTLF